MVEGQLAQRVLRRTDGPGQCRQPLSAGADRDLRAVVSPGRFADDAEAVRVANGTPYPG